MPNGGYEDRALWEQVRDMQRNYHKVREELTQCQKDLEAVCAARDHLLRELGQRTLTKTRKR